MLKTIKLTIILLFTFFLIVMFSLFSGIKINSFSFGNFSISQLYLKLDKKLILEIEDMVFELKSTGVNNSVEDIQRNISNLPILFKVFKKIDIERLKIKDNEFTILLTDKNLYLDSKFANFSGDIEFAGADILLDVSSLYLKDLKLTLIGKMKMNISKKIVNFFGEYDYKNLEGELNVQLTEDIFDFYINSNNSIKSIGFLKDFFRLDNIAEAWMYDNVTGDIKLNYLYGKIDLKKKEAIMDSLKGQVVINDAKIRFHKNAKTVDTKKLTIDYEDDTLSFDLFKPIYNKSKIYGSTVYITDLTSEQKGVVVVDLKTKEMLNDDILGILKAYDINLPLKQLKGRTDSTLVLKIPYLASKEMSVDGLFKVENALLKLEGFEFSTPKADVVLKDNVVTIGKSRVIHKEMLDAYLELAIDTSTSKASGNAFIKKFLIDTKTDGEIINIKDHKTLVGIDFNDKTIITLDNLNTDITVNDKTLDVWVHNISIANKYSKLLSQLNFDKGDILVKIKDENDINFKANLVDLNLPIEKDGKKLEKLTVIGSVSKNKTITKSVDGNISLKVEKGTKLLEISNLDLNLKADTKTKDFDLPSFDIKLKNSTVILDDKTQFKTEWADVKIKENKIFFEAVPIDLELPLAKDMKGINKLHVKGSFIDSVVNVKTLDGKLTLKYETAKEKLTMDVKDYDITYDTSLEDNKNSTIQYYITGTNSDIIINNEYTAKADTYSFVFEKYKTLVDLKYKETTMEYSKDSKGNIKANVKNMNDEFLSALLNKELIRGGSVNVFATGEHGILSGTAYMKDTTIINLAILNNLLIFINTSPALINPLLAVPSLVGMATNDGFDLRGYTVSNGKLDFTYNFEEKFLNIHKLFTKGNGIDFDGYVIADFKNQEVNSKLNLIFFKDYSKIVGAIPVINYIFLGDEKQVSTEVNIYGDLKDPKFKTNVALDSAKAPVNVIKRIITSPFKLFEEIKESFE